MLRLDTDHFDSVLSCLKSLYKKVEKNGYIIHDEYYSWKGHEKVINDFLSENGISLRDFRSSIYEKVQIK